ncbi:hypothetical protein RQP46_000843 [Phenoliferia psychrophenolica]
MERGLGSKDSFVVRKDGGLFVDDIPWRFQSFNAPELLDGDECGSFEIKDTMQTLALGFGRPVTRTYTLRIKSGRIGRGHINGWNNEWKDWVWDGPRLKEFDEVLDEAYKAGVRLIIPIINQDYGGEDTNWVGNTTDLIRMRKGLSREDAKKVDWWTDHEMIESFKLIIDKLVNRVNSINGRKYGEDPTILAWETGNEMNRNGYGAAPAEWTLKIAKHLKSRARQLVMDGSFARTDNRESCFPKAVLESPDVDIISYHYGGGDIGRLAGDCQVAAKYGKVFVAGEHGMNARADEYQTFVDTLDKAGGGGSLCWSLRPHSSKGGFKTHGEGNGHWSVHVPGWAEPLHGEFDHREASIVSTIRLASYKINHESVPPLPIPSPPSKIWFMSPTTLCWTGSPWASSYMIIVKNQSTGEERSQESVGKECTEWLGPAGYSFAQVSPPNEHISGDAWYTDYQPVSHIITSKRGNRTQFEDMVSKCREAGVGIIADAVLNLASGSGGVGVAGSKWSNESFPAVPFAASDFHAFCTDQTTEDDIWTCQLDSLPDLRTETETVRTLRMQLERTTGYLNYNSSNNAYTLSNVFLLAQPYGTPTILSGFNFSASDTGQGAPTGNTTCYYYGWSNIICGQQRKQLIHLDKLFGSIFDVSRGPPSGNVTLY